MKIPDQIREIYQKICCIVVHKNTMGISICDENMLMLRFSNNKMTYQMSKSEFSRFKRQIEQVANKRFILFEDTPQTTYFYDIDFAQKAEPRKFSHLAAKTQGNFIREVTST